MKSHHFLILLAILFYGCANNNKLTTSFGERKYNKGHFWNLPASIAPIMVAQQATQPKIQVSNKSFSVTNNKAISISLINAKLVYHKHLINNNILKSEKSISETAVSTHFTTPNNDPQDKSPEQEKAKRITSLVMGIILLVLGCLLGIAAVAIYIAGTVIAVPALAVLCIIALIGGGILLGNGIEY